MIPQCITLAAACSILALAGCSADVPVAERDAGRQPAPDPAASPPLIVLAGGGEGADSTISLDESWRHSFTKAMGDPGIAGVLTTPHVRTVDPTARRIDGAQQNRSCILFDLDSMLRLAIDSDHGRWILFRPRRMIPIGVTEEHRQSLIDLNAALEELEAQDSVIADLRHERDSLVTALRTAERSIAGAQRRARELAARLAVTNLAMRGRSLPGFSPDRFVTDNVAYLTDAATRCEAGGTLGIALAQAAQEGRRVVLVAHGQAALVAYLQLASLGDPVVHSLVTLGTYLGEPDLIPQLLEEDVSPPYPAPARLAVWRDVRNVRDPLASRSMRSAMRIGEQVDFEEYVSVTPSPDPHSLTSYLEDRVAAAVIARAWCHAHAPVIRPPACLSLPGFRSS